MTEREFLETKIRHLQERKRLMNAVIDFKIRILEESLALQDGLEVGGKYDFRNETFGD